MISDRCRSFDRRAKGYGRAEGVAAVAIQSYATVSGCTHAELLGIHQNNDGRSVTPITRPSAEQQKRCMSAISTGEALAAVECHGTGTKAGDPVEISSVQAVFGQSASSGALCIGALKANINHTESTAGLASLLKCCHVLACQGMFAHGGGHWAPETSIDVGALSLSDEFQHIEARPVGVNSFGFSGTNVHAQLQPAHEDGRDGGRPQASGDQVLLISSKTLEGLERQQEKLRGALQEPGLSATDVQELAGQSARQEAHGHRKVVLVSEAQDVKEVKELLEAEASGDEVPMVVIVAPGNGCQTPRMLEESTAWKMALLFFFLCPGLCPIETVAKRSRGCCSFRPHRRFSRS